MSFLTTADLHLKPETAGTVFQVLERFGELGAELDVDYLVMLGDIYDVRYNVPIDLQNRLLDWVVAQEREIIILPGNHDQDNVAGRHALEVFGLEPGVHVMTEPQWNDLGCWLPYRHNPLEISAFVQKTRRPESALNIGWLHHGIVGALMNDHAVAGERDGVHPSVFEDFDVVFAGHWHRHQEVKNCVYVGSPWQTRADEAGQEKGFIHMDEEGWELIPISVGKRHHRVNVAPGTVLPKDKFKEGDVVHVVVEDENDAKRVMKELGAKGLDIRLQPPKQKYGDDRLGLGTAASAQEYAVAYARENAGELDVTTLLTLLKEIIA